MNESFLDKLNPAQREAATTTDGPLLIIAGAGSGKTTVLVNRLAYMVESGINPANILLLTFTNTAADNMKERAEKLGKGCDGVTACTYHSFCAQILRKYARRIGLNPNFSIISPSEAADAIRLGKVELEFSKIKGIPNNATIVEILSKSVNTGRSIRDLVNNEYDKYWQYSEEIETIGQWFQNYKQKKHLCDYDDLLVFMNQILENPIIRQELANTYRYVMVDEYQDTNSLQEAIVMKLCSHHNLCVVGDDFQSIFGFNGSDINNILEFPQRMPGGKQVVIATNYRSTAEILAVANNVMDNFADFGFKKDMTDCGKTGKKAKLKTPENQDEEAEYIVNKIKKELQNGTPLKEIAVLFRSSMMSTKLELALNAEKIPYRKLGGLKFLDHVCIQDMLAYMRTVTNPADELAWYRILCLLPGIGDINASKIAKNCSTNLKFLTSGYENRIFARYLSMLQSTEMQVAMAQDSECINLLAESYYELRHIAIEVGKYSDEGKRTESYEQLEEDMVLVNQLSELSKDYATIPEFLDSIALEAAAPAESEELLTLSTIHSAKGMEWKDVFVLDCADRVFPKYTESVRGADDYYEELRCFYVALTRAKDKLYIMCPKTIQVNGEYIEGVPAHFLNPAIEAGLLDYKRENPRVPSGKKVYLNVPYRDKEDAKRLGAKWDPVLRQWYYYSDKSNDSLFYRWKRCDNAILDGKCCNLPQRGSCDNLYPESDEHEEANYNYY